MGLRSTLAAIAALFIACAESGAIINGATVSSITSSTERAKFEPIGSVWVNGSYPSSLGFLAGGCTLVAPGTVITAAHLFGPGCTPPASGAVVTVFKEWTGTPVYVPIQSWEYVTFNPGTGCDRYDFAIGYFDPALLPGVTPMTVDINYVRPANMQLSVAGYGSVCPTSVANCLANGTLRYATAAAPLNTTSGLVDWPGTTCCGTDCCSPSSCTTSCSTPRLGNNDSGSPVFYTNSSGDFVMIGIASAATDFTITPGLLRARLESLFGTHQFSSFSISYPNSLFTGTGTFGSNSYLWDDVNETAISGTTDSGTVSISTNPGTSPSYSTSIGVGGPVTDSGSESCVAPNSTVAMNWALSWDEGVSIALSGNSSGLNFTHTHAFDQSCTFTPTVPGNTGNLWPFFQNFGANPDNGLKYSQSFTIGGTARVPVDIEVTVERAQTASGIISDTGLDASGLTYVLWTDVDANGVVSSGDRFAAGQSFSFEGSNTIGHEATSFLAPGNYVAVFTLTGTYTGWHTQGTNCGVGGTFSKSVDDEVAFSISAGQGCSAPTLTEDRDFQSCPGADKTIAMSHTGSGTDWYLWYRGDVPLHDGGRISGAHSSALTISDVVAGDEGEYTCRVWTACGTDAYTFRLFVTDSDFDRDSDPGTEADIDAFFACLGNVCCSTCQTTDQDGNGDHGTDADIETFFRVLGSGNC